MSSKQKVIEPQKPRVHGKLKITWEGMPYHFALDCEHYAVVVSRKESAPTRLDEMVVCSWRGCRWYRSTLGRKVGEEEYYARRKRELSYAEYGEAGSGNGGNGATTGTGERENTGEGEDTGEREDAPAGVGTRRGGRQHHPRDSRGADRTVDGRHVGAPAKRITPHTG